MQSNGTAVFATALGIYRARMLIVDIILLIFRDILERECRECCLPTTFLGGTSFSIILLKSMEKEDSQFQPQVFCIWGFRKYRAQTVKFQARFHSTPLMSSRHSHTYF
jgi:hypothetical protein